MKNIKAIPVFFRGQNGTVFNESMKHIQKYLSIFSFESGCSNDNHWQFSLSYSHTYIGNLSTEGVSALG